MLDGVEANWALLVPPNTKYEIKNNITSEYIYGDARGTRSKLSPFGVTE